jgi:hypothetical protein
MSTFFSPNIKLLFQGAGSTFLLVYVAYDGNVFSGFAVSQFKRFIIMIC